MHKAVHFLGKSYYIKKTNLTKIDLLILPRIGTNTLDIKATYLSVHMNLYFKMRVVKGSKVILMFFLLLL